MKPAVNEDFVLSRAIEAPDATLTRERQVRKPRDASPSDVAEGGFTSDGCGFVLRPGAAGLARWEFTVFEHSMGFGLLLAKLPFFVESGRRNPGRPTTRIENFIGYYHAKAIFLQASTPLHIATRLELYCAVNKGMVEQFKAGRRIRSLNNIVTLRTPPSVWPGHEGDLFAVFRPASVRVAVRHRLVPVQFLNDFRRENPACFQAGHYGTTGTVCICGETSVGMGDSSSKISSIARPKIRLFGSQKVKIRQGHKQPRPASCKGAQLKPKRPLRHLS